MVMGERGAGMEARMTTQTQVMIGVAVLGMALAGAVAAQDILKVQSWPGDFDKVPCDVWQKEHDGKWVQVKTVTDGHLNFWGYWFLNTAQSVVLDQKCGKK